MAADKSRNSTPMDKLWQDVTPERLTGEAVDALDAVPITDEARKALAELAHFVAWRER